MTSEIVRNRLKAAGIPFPLPEEGVETVPLGRIFPWYLLSVTGCGGVSWGGIELVKEVAAALQLPPIPSSDSGRAMHVMMPVPVGFDAIDVLARAAPLDDSALVLLARIGRELAPADPRLRGPLLEVLGHEALFTRSRMEALFGLLSLGIGPPEAEAVVRQLGQGLPEVEVRALAVLRAHGHLEAALESGAIERALSAGKDTEFISAVLQLATGDVTGAADLFGHDDAEVRPGLYCLAAVLAGAGDVEHGALFEALLARLPEEDDNDAMAALSWALGRSAGAVGPGACERLVEAAVALEEGSWGQSQVLLALLGVEPPEGERAAVVSALEAVAIDDHDTQDAVQVALAWITGAGIPWRSVLRSRGVRAALMNPWRLERPFIRRMLNPDLSTARAEILSAVVSDGFNDDAHRALLVGWVLAQDPDAVGLLEALARRSPKVAAGPVSAALLLFDGPANVDPVVARLEVGANEGAPLPDVPEVWGRLLYGLTAGRRVQAEARALLRMAPVGARIMEAWLLGQWALTWDKEALAMLPRYSATVPRRIHRPPLRPFDSAVLGLRTDGHGLALALRSLPETARGAATQRALEGIQDRDTLLSFARHIELIGLEADDLFRAFRWLATQTDWIPRESGAVVAQAIPVEAFEGADAELAMLRGLCNGKDGDVQREARAAAARIGLDWQTGQPEDEDEDEDDEDSEDDS
jgi:hypothetical protein